MRFRSKSILAIVAIFSCISLFCVGFANWVITGGSVSVSGKITAESVTMLDSCISFDTTKGDFNSEGKRTGIEMYTLAQNAQKGYDGFLVDGDASPMGIVTIHLVVNIAELVKRNSLLSMQGSNPHINFETTVKLSGNVLGTAKQLLTCLSYCVIDAYYDETNRAVAPDPTVKNGEESATCAYQVTAIDSLEDKLYIDLQFAFDTTTIAEAQRPSFYGALLQVNLTFQTSIVED